MHVYWQAQTETFTDLEPYQEITVYMTATSGGGEGPATDSMTVRTLADGKLKADIHLLFCKLYIHVCSTRSCDVTASHSTIRYNIYCTLGTSPISQWIDQ